MNIDWDALQRLRVSLAIFAGIALGIGLANRNLGSDVAWIGGVAAFLTVLMVALPQLRPGQGTRIGQLIASTTLTLVAVAFLLWWITDPSGTEPQIAAPTTTTTTSQDPVPEAQPNLATSFCPGYEPRSGSAFGLVFSEGTDSDAEVLLIGGTGGAQRIEDAVDPRATGSRLVYVETTDPKRLTMRVLPSLLITGSFAVGSNIRDPSTSFDGGLVSFIETSGTTNRVRVLDTATEELTDIDSSRTRLTGSTISPDGRQVAWLSWSGATAELMVAAVAAPLPVAIAEGLTSRPSWSPDSTALAFSSDIGGFSRISIRSLDESGSELQLNQGAAHRDTEPSWLPDCMGVIFLRQVGGQGGVEIWRWTFEGSATLLRPGSGVRSSLSAFLATGEPEN